MRDIKFIYILLYLDYYVKHKGEPDWEIAIYILLYLDYYLKEKGIKYDSKYKFIFYYI